MALPCILGGDPSPGKAVVRAVALSLRHAMVGWTSNCPNPEDPESPNPVYRDLGKEEPAHEQFLQCSHAAGLDAPEQTLQSSLAAGLGAQSANTLQRSPAARLSVTQSLSQGKSTSPRRSQP